MKIILIGYRCTGKTTVGKRLAERLGVPFVDTDALVEKAAGEIIGEMVEKKGWAFFREKEKEAIKTLTGMGKSVIGTGGGAVLDEENAVLLKREGPVIWLIADENTIVKRMAADLRTASQRPRFSNQDLKEETKETLAAREPVYRRLADLTIDTKALGIDEAVDRIVSFLEGEKWREIP